MQQQCCRAGQILFILAAGLIFAGCNGRRSSSPSLPPRVELSVRVGVPTGPPRLLIERLGRAWARDAGARLEISAPGGEWPAADVILMPATEMPRWAASGKAMPLPKPEVVDAF